MRNVEYSGTSEVYEPETIIMGMEGFSNSIESREPVIDELIEALAEQEGMSIDFILTDIIEFAPTEGNESVNLEYLAEVAEKIGVTVEEMHQYAMLKAKES